MRLRFRDEDGNMRQLLSAAEMRRYSKFVCKKTPAKIRRIFPATGILEAFKLLELPSTSVNVTGKKL